MASGKLNASYVLLLAASAIFVTGCPAGKKPLNPLLFLLGQAGSTATPDTTPPTVLSTTPANNATDVSPAGGTITVVFSEPMDTSITPTLTAEGLLLWGWTSLPTSGTNFTWTDSRTLSISLSLVRFPEIATLRWTLSASGLQDAAGNQLAADVQQTFITGAYAVSFPVADTGQALCYNASASQACGNPSWPRQDADYANVPQARSFTGPTAHAIYTGDYTTTDNVTGLVWASCSNGLKGPTCSTGTVSSLTWISAISACASMNWAHGTGSGYAGHTDWRMPTVLELMTLVNYGVFSPSIDAMAFPGTPPGVHWSATQWTPVGGHFYVEFGGGAAQETDYPQTPHYVRCVAAP